jgi:hypothetical protein
MFLGSNYGILTFVFIFYAMFKETIYTEIIFPEIVYTELKLYNNLLANIKQFDADKLLELQKFELIYPVDKYGAFVLYKKYGFTYEAAQLITKAIVKYGLHSDFL